MDTNLERIDDFLFYSSDDGKIHVRVFVDEKRETIWTTQKGMAELFDIGIPAISKHLKNIFEDGELNESSVVSKMETTANDGKKYNTTFYNLDAIIAVGYRVNSFKATQFRIWATSVLKEYLIKGFALDDDRLKQGTRIFNKDHFRELVERIQEIRASERMFYEKITDIFRDCSDITILNHPFLKDSMRQFRTNFTMLYISIQLRRLSKNVQTLLNHIWV